MTAFKANIEHALTRNTVRIAAGAPQGQLTSTGTGFFYQVTHPTSNLAKVLILTNKHVVRGATIVQFVLSSAPSIAELDAQHQPKDRIDHPIFWSLAGNLIEHPDPSIDLCAIDITIPYGQVLQNGRQLRSMCIDSSWLPNHQDRVGMRDIEQVLVIGYPIGLWDEHNNMPIARRGSTATHPMAHYAGKRNFLVDVAAFQGSSGSPVFSYEAPMFRQPDGSFTPGIKVNFIGVVWGVIERTVAGKLQAVEIPSALEQVPVLQTSLNLAIALHSDAVKDLDENIFPGINATRGNAAA